MLNYLWGFMIILGVCYACITGNLAEVSNGALEAAGDAVSLCITMLGIMSVWTGLMKIAEKAGLIHACSRGIRPFMKWIFPDVPVESEAMQAMTTNMIANFLGLGWAATPAGIKAMEALAKLQENQGGGKKHFQKNGEVERHCNRASNAMCAFLVLNISSVQLIPMNIIAYRSEYGSADPTAIVLPAIIATTMSTLVGIVICRVMYGRES